MKLLASVFLGATLAISMMPGCGVATGPEDRESEVLLPAAGSPGSFFELDEAQEAWLAAADGLEPERAEPGALGPEARKGDQVTKACSGSPGGSNYCSPECPCGADEGDCDTDADCTSGNTCMRDTGALYGWNQEVDVCMPLCTDDAVGTPDFCSADCPCSAGEGDCDQDSDCEAGAVCATNVGAQFGFAADVDVCVDACDEILNGTWDYCSAACPCESGQGDCDSDADCADGTVCTRDVGADYGYDGEMDVCVGTSTQESFSGRVVVGGFYHTCVLLEDGTVRCWGYNGNGELGYGHLEWIGDNESVSTAGAVDVGGPVRDLAAGRYHTCALLENGSVRCWGLNDDGQLGYGHSAPIGDDEPPVAAGDVNVGGPVKQIEAGAYYTCALLDSGAVRCWGDNGYGQLGYGHTQPIGDNEAPATAGDVNVGGPVKQLEADTYHVCALLESGAVRCWGYNRWGNLGYGHTQTIGDNEAPATAGDVNVGGPVAQIAVGQARTCARLSTGAVRCWGDNQYGMLGYGHTQYIGDNEAPATAGDVPLGGAAVEISTGANHTCARLSTGSLRCWGYNAYGQLGYGHTQHIGDNESPASAGDVLLGGSAIDIGVGGFHSCAWLSTGGLRCWGYNADGQLGYGYTQHIGDNETPASVGDIPVSWLP